MCGFITIFNYNGSAAVDRDELLRIRDRMISRGPDGAGEWYNPERNVGLGHRRLAIIDLSEKGSQPMISEDGRIAITFNGEIYNYQELRSDLEMKGHHFRSTSDTEVLLRLYANKEEAMVEDLRGMYSFAIWDGRRHGMFLARDPFGIKPLYYSDDGKSIRAASQVKALLEGEGVDTSPDPGGHAGFFLWGHVPEPYTLYKGIRSLPAGTSMWVDKDGRKDVKTFCSIREELGKACRMPAPKGREEMRERLREALLDSVRHHLIADVPVGVFLSSGQDSTTLTALSSEIAPRSLNTVTLGFREYQGTKYDEVPVAGLVAKQFGTTHKTIWVAKPNFQAAMPHLMKAMDQPTVDGINNYFVSWAAVEAGLKVAISGLGGDELFGSYPSFHQVPRMVRCFRFAKPFPLLGKTFRWIAAPLLKRLTSAKYAGLLEYGGDFGGAYLLRRGMFMPWELPELLGGEMAREGWRDLQTLLRLEETQKDIDNNFLKVSSLEMSWYMRNQLLRDTDWASMAHSLEIRVPLVDIALLRAVVPMLGGAGTSGKREMALTPRQPLPREVMDRSKTGFSIPVREWIAEDGASAGERGMRGWAKRVYAEHYKLVK
jgi:asparagine synthase (glutamine-hydrolysing)